MALDRNLYVGKTLTGGFHIERFVGSGAFAYVYYAVSPQGNPCAVKVQYNLVDDARIRFAREIKVLKELPPNDYLVRYYSDGMLPEGYPYLIMEFVDGITLKESLKQRYMWPPREACSIMLQLCKAFDGLHAMGITHRDVKPDNIMITCNNQVKLMDLGLIKDSQGLLKLTEDLAQSQNKEFSDNLDKGVLAGTPEYMAPEQFSDPSLDDETQAKTDCWTDVYSLGLIFYEMITGRKLFPFTPDNSSQAMYARSLLTYLKKRTNQNDFEILPARECDPQLWSVIAKSLHSDPHLRQNRAGDLAEDIERYLISGEGVVESDSDKTSAIDITHLADFMPQNMPTQPVPKPVYSAAPQDDSVEIAGPVSPALPPYADSNYQNGFTEQEEAEDNTWLWLTVITLLFIVIVILVFFVYFF